ncbi:MAG: hypothetical protein A2901_08475 [Elusimicrobia bacterium RIFCSPLOWO2_01_FULL_54_10]|nr:MAG: hypothetical protein A2901_08475 [Elusimicrobia bacterium RIFCSPLOWO2_01_FULL_54_10]
MVTALTLCSRELSRFFRQRSRVAGAILPPLLFWFLIGSGLSGSFRHEGSSSYLQYFFPGTVVMIVLFAAIFSTISIIEDRREGFLQVVLVSPAPRWSIALGKIAGGASIAFLHGAFFLLLSPWVGASWSIHGALFGAASLAGISVGLTALGFLIAWKMDSTQAFHAVMNLFLMPMWFLSGSLFPLETSPGWLRAVMTANPLTYGVAALREALFGGGQAGGSLWVCLAFAVLLSLLAVVLSSKPERP